MNHKFKHVSILNKFFIDLRLPKQPNKLIHRSPNFPPSKDNTPINKHNKPSPLNNIPI